MTERITKRLTGYSTAHRVHAADSHCQFVHGYDRSFEFVIEGDPDPATGFVFDFGAFGSIKAALAEQFDHTLIVAPDDPHIDTFRAHAGILWRLRIMDHPGMEGAARWCLDEFGPAIRSWSDGRARLVSVTVSENDRNSATVYAPGWSP